MTDALPAVRLEDVRQVFDGRHLALAGLDLELRRGELVLLMGPNGAGKSTLVSLLSTLARPTSGEIRFGALRHAEARRALRHRIGLVGHAPMLYEHLTVRENLLFFARLYRLRDPAGAVAGAIARAELETFAGRAVGKLSRGMTQRAAVARALLGRPQLLLLDEPFSGLDQAAVARLRAELGGPERAERITVVVTHDLEAVDGLADRLVVLDEGQIAADVTASAAGPAPGRLSARALAERYRDAVGREGTAGEALE